MNLDVMATGSTGNASILTSENGETIGLDFGLSFKKWHTLLEKNNHKQPTDFFITHSHGDHMNASGLSALLRKYPDTRIHTNRGTFETRDFDLVALLVPHNVKNNAFCITEKSTGQKLVYVTDCSSMYKTLTLPKYEAYYKNADIYALEANYDDRYLYNPDVLDQMDYKYNVFSNMERHTSKQECLKTYAALKKDTSRLVMLHQSTRFFNF